MYIMACTAICNLSTFSCDTSSTSPNSPVPCIRLHPSDCTPSQVLPETCTIQPIPHVHSSGSAGRHDRLLLGLQFSSSVLRLNAYLITPPETLANIAMDRYLEAPR